MVCPVDVAVANLLETLINLDNIIIVFDIREAVKNYLADFFRWGGTPPYPPTPLTENHFAKKPLAERGGTP